MVEHSTKSRRVVGSNPIWDSDFFESTFLLLLRLFYSIKNSYYTLRFFLFSLELSLGQLGLKHQRFLKQPWSGEILLKEYEFKVLVIAYRD